MPQQLVWKAQPLFISSTFTDMMAERDVLRDFVFPELEERLNERRVRLEPIDLRWGVETKGQQEQEEKELLVLKVCLNEIERCRPFFIGIIGERYGWVPPEKRMKDAETEKGFESSLKDKSVTALEIEYGVLAVQNNSSAVFSSSAKRCLMIKWSRRYALNIQICIILKWMKNLPERA